MPRVGILGVSSGLTDAVREAGGEPVDLGPPGAHPAGGVALHREWVADRTQIFAAYQNLDALLLDEDEPGALAGLLLAALRLDLPAVVAAPGRSAFSAALTALGFASMDRDAEGAAVEVARNGGPRSRGMVDNFSLANALRAGLSLGAGPELFVHLAAIAREAGTFGFPQMIRVLAPETVSPTSSPFGTSDVAVLLARLGDILHDTETVTGRLKEALPLGEVSPSPEDPAVGPRLAFARGRASGAEILCRTEGGETEISGPCRVYPSEEAAVRAVGDGAVGPSDLLVVGGCGPRGGPGLLRLDRLGGVLCEAGLAVPILTDGLPPEGYASAWACLATPEATAGGVLGRLRDGDSLRLDLKEGLIRTGVRAEEILSRDPLVVPSVASGYGYAARYASSALPALEGAGFG